MRLRRIVLGLLSIVMTSCATQRIQQNQIIQAELSSTKSVEAQEYRISAGDKLDIKFFYNPELNVTVVVRPDGRISLQLVDEVAVAGITPAQLDVLLTSKYSRELKRPDVTVIVKSFGVQQVYVGGEVGRQGPVKLVPRMTPLQAIINAGGFKDTAKPEAVMLIRKGLDSQPVPHRINLTLASDEPADATFDLQPYDIVYVPKSWIAEADQFVKQYVEGLLMFKGFYLSFDPTTRR